MRTLVQVEKIWHTWEVNYSIAGLWHSVQSLIFAMNSRFMTTPLLWAMVCWKLHSGKLHKLVKNRKSQGKKKKKLPLSWKQQLGAKLQNCLENSKNPRRVLCLRVVVSQYLLCNPSPLRTVDCPATFPPEHRRAKMRSYGEEQEARRWE